MEHAENRHLDRGELVEERWPLHGPYTPQLAEAAAEALAQLVRYLNYATGQGAPEALPYASHGYTVTGSLRAAANLHTQLLAQLSEWAGRLAADPTLRHAQDRDTPSAAVEAARTASDALWSAIELANRLSTALAVAQSALTWLAHDVADEGGLDE